MTRILTCPFCGKDLVAIRQSPRLTVLACTYCFEICAVSNETYSKHCGKFRGLEAKQ